MVQTHWRVSLCRCRDPIWDGWKGWASWLTSATWRGGVVVEGWALVDGHAPSLAISLTPFGPPALLLKETLGQNTGRTSLSAPPPPRRSRWGESMKRRRKKRTTVPWVLLVKSLTQATFCQKRAAESLLHTVTDPSQQHFLFTHSVQKAIFLFFHPYSD